MISNYYCQEYDKYINQKFKHKHMKSKAHLSMYYIIVTNKYNIGDVYWSDIETIIHEYIRDNSTKFYSFTILFRCKLNGEDINIQSMVMNGVLFYINLKKVHGSIINIVKVNKYEIISCIVLC